MPYDFNTILMTLLSAASGGAVALISVFLTNRSNTKRLKMQFDHESIQRKTELLRSRGEELYELTEKWRNAFFGYYLRRSGVMQGKLTYNQCLDMDIKDGKEASSYNFSRIEMLVDVYFPDARPAYDKMMASRAELNKVELAYRRAYEDGDIDGTHFLTPYIQCQKTVEKAGDDFQAKVLEYISAL